MKIIIFSLLPFLIFTGCRSAKPLASYETVADSVGVSAASSLSLSHDSVSISGKAITMMDDKINFVESGGVILISSDGSVALSGVAEVKLSQSRTSEGMKTMDSLTIQSQKKDSVAVSHQSTSHSEMKPVASSRNSSRKLKIAFALIILLMIITAISKLKTQQTLINH